MCVYFQLLELCTEKLHLVSAARKVYLSDGTLVRDFSQINKNDDIYISCGEPFKDPFGKYFGKLSTESTLYTLNLIFKRFQRQKSENFVLNLLVF